MAENRRGLPLGSGTTSHARRARRAADQLTVLEEAAAKAAAAAAQHNAHYAEAQAKAEALAKTAAMHAQWHERGWRTWNYGRSS